jgi:MSHA pilin protein MshD
MRAERSLRCCGGFTIVELIIFIVVVSVGLVGILSVLNLTARNSADPMIHKQMLAIAESLADEVSSMPFTYCDPDDQSATTASLSGGAIAGCTIEEDIGPEAGETRTGATPFDNINDYFVPGGLVLDPVTDIANTSNPNLAGYNANIQITAESLNGIASSSAGADTMEVLRIAVTVNRDGFEPLLLETYRTRHSPNSVP